MGEFTLYMDFNSVLISIISSCQGNPSGQCYIPLYSLFNSVFLQVSSRQLFRTESPKIFFFFFFSFKYNQFKESIIWPLKIGSQVNLNAMLCLVAQLCGLFATPWTIACQVPLSMEFSRPEYWSEQPFPSPRDLPTPGIEPRSPALQADSLPSENEGTPNLNSNSN